MCGRLTQRYTWSEVHSFLSVIGAAKNLRPRYNIAPTTTIDVVSKSEDGRELVSMRWGLVPVWWKKPLKDVPAGIPGHPNTWSRVLHQLTDAVPRHRPPSRASRPLSNAQQVVIENAKATISVDEANQTFAEQENKRYSDLATSAYGSAQNARTPPRGSPPPARACSATGPRSPRPSNVSIC